MSESVNDRVESKPARDPAVRAFAVAAMLIGFGIYCMLDYKNYPYVPLSESLDKFFTWALNWYGQFVFTAVGAVFAVWAGVHLSRTVVADEEGIGNAGGLQLKWQDVESVDASKLQSKQILRLNYSDGSIKLYGWRRQNFRELVAFIDAHLPDRAKS